VGQERDTARLRRLSEEWDSLLHEIRSIDGFRNFLLPKPIDELRQAAAQGTVVILNVSYKGCDALAVTLNGVLHIPLRNISMAILKALVALQQTTLSADSEERLVPLGAIPDIFELSLQVFLNRDLAKDDELNPDDLFRFLLQELWTEIVQPVIQSLGLKVSSLPISYLRD
jgi:hypothetical protein